MLRLALYVDTISMAFGTIRANKLRSFLTVLGIVIGIMAIVGMTSLIRGFDNSVRDMIREMGPKTIYLAKSGPMMGGDRQQFLEIMKRPNITLADAKALKELDSLAYVDIMFGQGGPGGANERAFYQSFKTKSMPILGTTERYAEVN